MGFSFYYTPFNRYFPYASRVFVLYCVLQLSKNNININPLNFNQLFIITVISIF